MDQLTLSPEEQRLLELTAAPLAPARQAQLADFVLSEIHQESRRSRKRTFGVIAAIVAALTLTTGVAYAFIASTASPKDPYVAYCYPNTNPDRGKHWTGNTITAVADLKGDKPVVSAVTTCAQMWDMGVVHAPGPAPTKSTGNPVPELTACIDPNGDTVVFPADSSICGRLGFPSLR